MIHIKKLEMINCIHFSFLLLPLACLALFPQQTKRDLEKLVDEINAGRPQCPVGLNTLVIPRKVTLSEQVNQPYVYLNCGHVQGKFLKPIHPMSLKFILRMRMEGIYN